MNVVNSHVIVEEEYQKIIDKHDMSYRSDIIVHVPFEEGVTETRREGNFVVFELKIRANKTDALTDFDKLNDYITKLDYPLCVFVNINSDESFIELVRDERIHIMNVLPNGNSAIVLHSCLGNGRAICQEL
jgi:hypothetical protein